MAKIPDCSDDIVDKIYEGIERKEKSKFRLSRLGASSIGKECPRMLWYAWRGFFHKEFGGRMLRLFRTGHLQEMRIVEDLKNAGFHVWEIDESTGEQWTYTDESGHLVAKLDGVIKGIPGAPKTAHTLEIKTHNKKSFDSVSKSGVETAKPEHYAQMIVGMKYSGIERALYVAVCKDDERYHVERIVFDPAVAEKLAERKDKIIRSTIPPCRMCNKADDFFAKFCDAVGVCFNGEAPLKNCRTCVHSEPIADGQWACSILNQVLSMDEQMTTKACQGEHYEVIT